MAKIVVANMKNVLTKYDIENYINKIDSRLFSNIDLIFCPSNIYLNCFRKKGYFLGAQNVHYDNDNLCTGEISAMQLKNLDVKYVIVGHSERRRFLFETDEMINKKVISCLKESLNVILCVGEDIKEKHLDETLLVLKNQILNVLKGVTKDEIENIIIAYEPTYAIGSGNALEITKIKEIVNYIKSIIFEVYNSECKVIYGGSVNFDNINKIINVCDGVMVGKLCFNYDEFLNLIRNIL